VRKFSLLLATPSGMLLLAGVTLILYKVWNPSLQDEIFLLFLVLLLALSLAQERLMFRVTLLGEGLHIHLDRAGMTFKHLDSPVFQAERFSK
jgi:hypothetical protein